MRIANYDYEAMPLATRNLYRLVMDKTQGIQSAFAEKINVKQQTFTRLFRPDPRTGRYPVISPEIRSKVCKSFALDSSFFTADNDKDLLEADGTRPRLVQTAAAGCLTEQLEVTTERYPVIRQLPDYDFTIKVSGDSMEPEIKSGDELACVDVSKESFIQWGKIHVLSTRQGIVVKRIYQEPQAVRCESDNPRYSPFSVPLEDIFNICLVVGLLRL